MDPGLWSVLESRKGESDMQSGRFWKQAALVFMVFGVGALLAAPAADAVKMPGDFKGWYLANSMMVTKEPNKFGLITGNHLIYVNAIGLERLKRGGSTPYPDGTIFVDDVRDTSLDDGAYVESGRKAVPVMVKDSKKYAATGGWGFQAWAGGDAAKPLVTDAAKQCFACHLSQKAHDFAFSTYIE